MDMIAVFSALCLWILQLGSYRFFLVRGIWDILEIALHLKSWRQSSFLDKRFGWYMHIKILFQGSIVDGHKDFGKISIALRSVFFLSLNFVNREETFSLLLASLNFLANALDPLSWWTRCPVGPVWETLGRFFNCTVSETAPPSQVFSCYWKSMSHSSAIILYLLFQLMTTIASCTLTWKFKWSSGHLFIICRCCRNLQPHEKYRPSRRPEQFQE